MGPQRAGQVCVGTSQQAEGAGTEGGGQGQGTVCEGRVEKVLPHIEDGALRASKPGSHRCLGRLRGLRSGHLSALRQGPGPRGRLKAASMVST